ncbi:MAG: helix-turn-helix transcriptional regulator, partial [Clostridia bacterium]|nr:helix-turn-helix transcriptional regulator [Clostridia bacterium]
MRSRIKKPINVIVGENIRYYREKSGYSREKLAELVGFSPQFLTDAENGFVGVSITSLKRICEVLGVSADNLLWNKVEKKISIDEKLLHVDEKYIPVIEEVIQ